MEYDYDEYGYGHTEEQRYAQWSEYAQVCETYNGKPLSYSAWCDMWGWFAR